MKEQDPRRLVFHGAIVLLAGALCGLPEGAAVGRGAPETEIHAWRVAHDALVAGGIMLIAIGAALRYLILGERTASLLMGALLTLAYGAVVGLGLGALAGVQGLAPTGPPLNFVAFVGNFAVAAGTLVALPIVIWGARGGGRSTGA
jgi:hypothetical protein